MVIHRASIRLTWDNKSKTRLLTAFEKKETSEPTISSTDVESNLKGKQDDTATLLSSDVSGSKDKKEVVESQDKDKNFGVAVSEADKAVSEVREDISSIYEESRMYRKASDTESREAEEIVFRAKADGSYMKAPNGEATKLSKSQWVQVRTRAFKDWFGDWEKVSRIEKLRNSAPIEISGREIEPSEDLKQYKKNALDYGKKFRSFYKNKDTGASVYIGKSGVKAVLNHDYKDVEQLQSIASIPQIIENSRYIESRENTDLGKHKDVSEYHYYVCGLKIDGVDYTVRAVIAEQPNGNCYYDHKLSKIEKGKLLDSLSRTTPGINQKESSSTDVKDTKLVSLLQVNSSKLLDSNGEPKAEDISKFESEKGD
ncbi:MAG: hypothetical protein RR513_07580, partial [Muribaculaceae bacterium]